MTSLVTTSHLRSEGITLTPPHNLEPPRMTTPLERCTDDVTRLASLLLERRCDVAEEPPSNSVTLPRPRHAGHRGERRLRPARVLRGAPVPVGQLRR